MLRPATCCGSQSSAIAQGTNSSKGAHDDGGIPSYPRPSASPPVSPMPGSPLTYSPQVPMEPIVAKQEDFRAPEFHGVSAWPAGPKLVPVVISCERNAWRCNDAAAPCAQSCPPVPSGSHGGTHVEVEGSFDNWTTRQVLLDLASLPLHGFTLAPLLYLCCAHRCCKGRAKSRPSSSFWRRGCIRWGQWYLPPRGTSHLEVPPT